MERKLQLLHIVSVAVGGLFIDKISYILILLDKKYEIKNEYEFKRDFSGLRSKELLLDLKTLEESSKIQLKESVRGKIAISLEKDLMVQDLRKYVKPVNYLNNLKEKELYEQVKSLKNPYSV